MADIAGGSEIGTADMRVAAILVAAGRGLRLGAARPKQFLELAPGRTMLQMSIDALARCACVTEIVVALPPGHAAEARVSPDLRADATTARVVLVEGGERRQDSVANAFARVSTEADVDRDSRCGAAVCVAPR